MAGKTVLDNYSQFAVGLTGFTASADATVVKKLETGITNNQKVAWAVKRLDYDFYGPMDVTTRITTAANYISFGWTQNALDTNPYYGLTSASIIDYHRIYALTTNAGGVGLVLSNTPYIHIFDDPVLVLPQTLYTFLDWATAANMAATQYIMTRMWYKEIELTSEDWYDLLQLRLPLGAQA